MGKVKKNVIIGVGIVIALLFTGIFGYTFANQRAEDKYLDLLDEMTEVTENLATASHKNVTLRSLLDGKDEETKVLRAQIAAMKDKPAEIRYIVRTETVIEGRTDVVTVLPDNYTHRLENNLAVASFASNKNPEDPEFTFDTFDLTFKNQIVIGEDETSVLLTARSSAEPNREIYIEVDNIVSTKVRERPLFMPNIGIGLTGSVLFEPNTQETPVGGAVSASVYMSLFHPNENLDVIQIRGTFNATGARVGFDPVSFNIAAKIPIFTDLWLAPGISIGTQSKYPSVDLTIGSKF
jgi:hypothetical protein